MAGATGKAEAMPRTPQIIAQQQRAMSSALLAARTIAQVLASVFDPLALSKSGRLRNGIEATGRAAAVVATRATRLFS